MLLNQNKQKKRKKQTKIPRITTDWQDMAIKFHTQNRLKQEDRRVQVQLGLQKIHLKEIRKENKNKSVLIDLVS